MDALLWIVAVALVIAGIAGAILPALLGAPLVFAGLLLGAWIGEFEKVGGPTLTVLAILTVISFITDIAATALGAKRVDASRQAMYGAALGTAVGIFAGFPGLILGPFIGAAIGEYRARRDVIRAGEVGVATWMGLLLGAAAKLALCFMMLGLFVMAYFWK